MGITVNKIEKAGAIDRRKSAKGESWGRTDYESTKEHENRDDSVSISDEARKRASGKHKKNILEHLAEPD